MTAIFWSLPSLRDTRRISELIKAQDPAAALKVVNAIETSVERLGDFPLSAPIVERGPLRKISVPRYPYLVFYRVGRTGITVTRVRHAHEDWPRL